MSEQLASPKSKSSPKVSKKEPKETKVVQEEPKNDDKIEIENEEPASEEIPSVSEETVEPSAVPASSFGNWFTSIVNTVGEKVTQSSDTFESIRRDLSEFKQSVQQDTTNIMNSTASLLKTTITEIGNTVNDIGTLGAGNLEENDENEPKLAQQEPDESPTEELKTETSEDSNSVVLFNLESINSWTNALTGKAKSTFSMVKETLVDSMLNNFDLSADDLNEEPYVIVNQKLIPIANWKQLKNQLQTNKDTYCREPSGSPEDFDRWLANFHLDSYKKQIDQLLESVPEMKQYYEQLVPQTLSHIDFWNRYYYKLAQLEDEQKRLVLQRLQSSEEVETEQTQGADQESTSHVDIKYLSEKAKKSPAKTNSKRLSRSNTDEWEAMPDASGQKVESSISSSDETEDWVKLK